MQHAELLIIGGGAAGQAAAIHAAQLNIQTLLVDEGPVSREWMARQIPRWYGERLPSAATDKGIADRYLAKRPGLATAGNHGVDIRTGCACWGLFEGRIAGLYDGHRAWFVQVDNIILATGSHEHPLAFVGRSLPGVLGGLGAIDLLDTCGTLAGNRVVVLGSGNFGLEVAQRCRLAGHDVAAVVEANPEPIADAALIHALEREGTEVISGFTVVYVSGSENVEQVMLGGIDEHGRRLLGESFPVKADTLCVATGRAPSIDLAYLIGCDIGFDTRLGGYFPKHSASMETTVPGVFVAGDVAGALDTDFGTPESAEKQGRIAARSVASRLGRISDADSGHQHRPVSTPLASDTCVSINEHAQLWQRASIEVSPHDVVICRCEGVTRADLTRAFDVVGNRAPDEIKRVSRAGMGVCQGRGCRMVMAELLASRNGNSPAEVPIGSYRPPVRPVPMAALADIDPPEVPLHPVFAALEREFVSDIASGKVSADRLSAAAYKIREENFLARGLTEKEIAQRAHELGITIRTVRVH